MLGMIFNIQKFCLHDGPGIRTTVFFKGCNLRCRWCANPESQQMGQEVTLDRAKCAGCGACVTACPQGARKMETIPVTCGSLCLGCGRCVSACPAGAVAVEGRRVTVEQVLAEAEKDKVFYDGSGGGVTLSGGEVLLQLPFALELAGRLRQRGIHVAAETAGAARSEDLMALAEGVDLLIMDLKHYDDAAHRAGTGVGNGQILMNLQLLKNSGREFVLRIPVIPGFNHSQEHAHGFGRLLRQLQIDSVELLPFHRLGAHKYTLLGRQYEYAAQPSMTREELTDFARILGQYGIRTEV